jgi:predicted small metal-binding protein
VPCTFRCRNAAGCDRWPAIARSSHFAAAGISRRPATDDRRQEVHTSTHEHKHIACGDVVPGCTWTAQAPTDEELVKKVVAHAAEAHGVTEVTPELADKVRAAIETR